MATKLVQAFSLDQWRIQGEKAQVANVGPFFGKIRRSFTKNRLSILANKNIRCLDKIIILFENRAIGGMLGRDLFFGKMKR